MTKIETTRRAMLGAMAVTPVALTVPGMAAQRTPDRRAWNAAMAAFEKAKAEDKAFDAVFDPISQKFADEVAKLPQYPDQFAVRFARGAVREFDAGKVFVEDYARPDFDKRLAEHRALVAADDERTAKIAEIDKRFGYSEAEEKWEALGDAAYKAEWVVMDTPAQMTHTAAA